MKTTEAGLSCKPQGITPHSLQRHIIRSLGQAIYHPALYLSLSAYRAEGPAHCTCREPAHGPAQRTAGAQGFTSAAPCLSGAGVGTQRLLVQGACPEGAPTYVHMEYVIAGGQWHTPWTRLPAWQACWEASLGPALGAGPGVGKGESVGSRRAAETHPQP